jgi:hypothetical protein
LHAESECKKNGDSCAIDWDPWTGAQDGEIIGEPKFTVKYVRGKTAKIIVSYTFDNGPLEKRTSRSATVILARSPPSSCWAVADVESMSLGSVRSYLERAYNKH